MKVTIPATRARFEKAHKHRIRSAMADHWNACRDLLNRKVIQEAVDMGTLPAELLDGIATAHKELGALRIKPRMATMIGKAGNEAMQIIEAARKGLIAWMIASGRMETKDFNPLTDRVLTFLETEAEYFEVEFSIEMIQTLKETLSSALSGNWSINSIEAGLRESVGLTTKQAASVARQFDAFTEDFVKQGMTVRQATEKAEGEMARYARRMERLRRETIARTEVGRAYGHGQQEAVRQAIDLGIAKGAKKTWRHSGLTENAREEHMNMGGETVGVDEPFSNGEQYPGMINCRCDVEYSVEV